MSVVIIILNSRLIETLLFYLKILKRNNMFSSCNIKFKNFFDDLAVVIIILDNRLIEALIHYLKIIKGINMFSFCNYKI